MSETELDDEQRTIDFVDLYDPMRIIRSAIVNLPRIYKGGKSTLYWVAVRDLFGYGSTTSQNLCRHFGINPHSEIGDSL